MSSILNHDMTPIDPYSTNVVRYQSSMRRSSSITRTESSMENGSLSRYNFDGNARQIPVNSISVLARENVPAPESFYNGKPDIYPQPRPRGLPAFMVDPKSVQERIHKQHELAQFEQRQLQELSDRRIQEQSKTTAAPDYLGKYDITPSPTAISIIDHHKQILASVPSDMYKRRLPKVMNSNHFIYADKKDLYTISNQPVPRIKNRFTECRGDGPPLNMNFGTPGGGAPMCTRKRHPIDPNMSAMQAQYRADLNAQMQFNQQQHQQDRQSKKRAENETPLLSQSHQQSQDVSYHRRHVSALRSSRPLGFELPSIAIHTETQYVSPACFYNGHSVESRTSRRFSSSTRINPTPSEHDREMARNPRRQGTDITTYLDHVTRGLTLG